MKLISSFTIIICVLIMFTFTGCTSKKIEKDSSISGTDSNSSAEVFSDELDLTKFSSTMIYSEVYNLVSMPEKYLGRSIRVGGKLDVYHDNVTNNDYFAVIIDDATACCQQGLEFKWNGEHSYPQDYPAKGTEIEISGIYSSYEEDGNTYYYILTDDIKEL